MWAALSKKVLPFRRICPSSGSRTGDAAQGDGLSAAGGSQQGQRGSVCVELDRQMEGPQPLSDVYMQAHQRFPPLCSRFSSSSTVSRNTAEMAMFTSTHRSAPASSLVRQSW